MKTLGYKFFAILTVLVLLCAGGCVKNEFNITFQFPKDFTGNYIVNYYAWNSKGGMWIETTASVQEGTAEVPCVTRRPTLVYIRNASMGRKPLIIYAERGDKITISGDSPDFDTWKVTGNDLTEEWSAWRNSLSGKDRQKAVEDFVKKNPENKLSAIMMLTEWDRNADSDGFVRLWNSIDEDAKESVLIEMCGAPDFPGIRYAVTAEGDLSRTNDSKMRSLTVRSFANGVDTLRLVGKKASLLFFYQDNNSGRGEAIDSIKSLTKAYPDSTRRIISDIYAESDSMIWVQTIRNDSTAGVVRGWMPQGLADNNMAKLGIGRIPWWIVTDRNARQVYSGNDLKKAVSAFRKEMGKKDPPKKTAPKGAGAKAAKKDSNTKK